MLPSILSLLGWGGSSPDVITIGAVAASDTLRYSVTASDTARYNLTITDAGDANG